MKSILIHLVFFSLIGLCCFQSFSQTFSQVYEERLAFNMPTSILEGDSFYIVAAAGYTAFSGTLSYRFGIKLFKTDKQGNLIWKKIYSESGKGISIGSYGSLAEVADGYLICGDEYDTTTTDVTFVLMKFDNEGDFQWIKSYPRGGKQECFHGSLTSDKSYIMIGETFFNNQSSDYYVLKTDSLGNKEWDRTYGINGTQDRGFNVYQVYDGGYVLGGISNSFGDPADSWIVKIDSAGDEEWSDTYGTSGEDVLVNLSASASGYLVWGGRIRWFTTHRHNTMK